MNSKIQIVTLSDYMKWDEIVKSFKHYDVYWLSGYVRAFEINGDGQPLLFFYENSDTRGINVVMKRDISCTCHFFNIIEQNRYFDFSTPYGYGGWIIEGDGINELFRTYEEWCLNNNIISEFVRFHPIIMNNVTCENSYKVIQLGKVVTLDTTSSEKIWSNLTSKNRNCIRKAQKNSIKIYNGRYPQIYRVFMDIYNKTMDKDNADKYYYFSQEFYDSVLNNLPYNSQVFYAEYEEKVIAASIMLMSNRKMNYHLSASLKEYSSLAASNLLLYSAAVWASNNGYETLYLGGGVGSREDNLFKFKKSFFRGEDLYSFYIGKKIFNKNVYDELVKKSGIEERNFFPQYRSK